MQSRSCQKSELCYLVSRIILGLLLLLGFIIDGAFRIKRRKLGLQAKRHRKEIEVLKSGIAALKDDKKDLIEGHTSTVRSLGTKVYELEERLKPQLDVEFDADRDGCVDRFQADGINRRDGIVVWELYRVAVTSRATTATTRLKIDSLKT